MAIQDFLDRIRVRQGPSGSAGMWLFQTGPMADRAFVGMVDDIRVGLYGNTGARWGFLMNTTTGNVGIGTQTPDFKLDVADRIRVRQGNSGSAGMWFFQQGANPPDRAFIGMVDNDNVGLFGNTGAGFGLAMNVASGKVQMGAPSINWGCRLQIDVDSTTPVGLAVTSNRDDVGTIFARNNASRGLAGDFQGGLFATGNGASPGLSANSGSNRWAGDFHGDVRITGSLLPTLSQFMIDHPLDPANRYLSHSVIESDELKNVYDGVVGLDADGAAEIQLGGWCEAFNHSFRYQLTPIGGPAPDLHVAREFSGNRFRIAGGRAGMTVCWQLTGVRQDAYARAHPLLVEEDKPAHERGYYLHPEPHGQPAERSVEWARNPERMRLISERAHAVRVRSDDGEAQADVQPAVRK